MDFAFLGLILDGFVMAGLLIAIYFAVSITRTFNAFKTARYDMADQIKQLNNSLEMAENALKTLKVESMDTAEGLKSLINNASDVATELEIITRSGARLADRLEGGYKTNLEPSQASNVKSAKENNKAQPKFSTKAEQDLYEALEHGKAKNRGGNR